MAKYRRGREKLHAALHRLAVMEGDVRARLKSANFYLRQLHEGDLPAEMWEEVEAIRHQLTRRGPVIGEDGEVWQEAIDHTLEHMRNRTGRRLAERIFQLAREIGTI